MSSHQSHKIPQQQLQQQDSAINFIIITTRIELWKVLFLAPSVCVFCLCNILGTTEWICAKFRKKMCLVPCCLNLRVWRLRSKVKVTRDKKRHFSALSAACMRFLFDKTSIASSFIFSFFSVLKVICCEAGIWFQLSSIPATLACLWLFFFEFCVLSFLDKSPSMFNCSLYLLLVCQSFYLSNFKYIFQ